MSKSLSYDSDLITHTVGVLRNGLISSSYTQHSPGRQAENDRTRSFKMRIKGTLEKPSFLNNTTKIENKPYLHSPSTLIGTPVHLITSAVI